MRLHLIRHGQTNWNKERRVQGQTESELTQLGREQASALRPQMAEIDIAKVYCSSSLRTRQTADCIFSETGKDIEYWDALREINLGPWEGQLYDDIAIHSPTDHSHFWEAPHLFNVSGAETFQDIQDRGVAAIHRIAEQHPGDEIALVSHGAIIKTILSHVEGRPLSRLWEPPQMHNCAHSILEFNSGGNVVIIQYANQPVGGAE